MKEKSLLGKLVRFADPENYIKTIGIETLWLMFGVAKIMLPSMVGIVIAEKQKTHTQPIYCKVRWYMKRHRKVLNVIKSLEWIAAQELTDDMEGFES